MDKGYARKLNVSAVYTVNQTIWYVPHFAVTNANKAGKMRLVFDAASKTNGYSLNDMLIKGPDLLISLYGILCKFRQKRIAFVGDIKEMFPQVRIIEEDQAAQRFLWRNNYKNKQPEEYQMVSMMFGTKCSLSSAQYIKNRNALQYRDEFPTATKAVIEKHYMDHYLNCCDTEEEAIKQIKEVIEVHKRGCLEICNWTSKKFCWKYRNIYELLQIKKSALNQN